MVVQQLVVHSFLGAFGYLLVFFFKPFRLISSISRLFRSSRSVLRQEYDSHFLPSFSSLFPPSLKRRISIHPSIRGGEITGTTFDSPRGSKARAIASGPRNRSGERERPWAHLEPPLVPNARSRPYLLCPPGGRKGTRARSQRPATFRSSPGEGPLVVSLRPDRLVCPLLDSKRV